MPLRVLGPLVVLSTLAVLGTGLALIAVGPDAGRASLLVVLGYRVSTLTLHQGTFIVWATVTGLHTLGRAVPALRILSGPTAAGHPVPGRWQRGVLLLATVLVAVLTAILVLNASGAWLTTDLHRHHPPRETTISP
jgi:hypothetical protein